MTTLDAGRLRRSDLVFAADHTLVPSDQFEVRSTICGGYPATEDGLSRLVRDMAHSPVPTSTVHVYLVPDGHPIELPQFPPSNLHFDIDQEHQVAAASLVVWDRDDEIHQWVSVGEQGRADVVLSEDPEAKRYPPESFITVPQLQEVVLQWAFGEIIPPPAIQWREAAEREVGWM